MLLRYYVNFYDMEIIEEEAFLSWKEDLTQEYPGKGKALFQVMCSHWSMALCGLPPLTPLCLFVNETLQWLYCCSGAGESVADLAGDCRRGGVRGWRVLRNRPKPCLIRCRLVLGFFSLLIFPSFLFRFFFFPPVFHALLVTTVTVHFTMRLFCQHHKSYLCSKFLYCSLWCPTADVLYTSINLGLRVDSI